MSDDKIIPVTSPDGKALTPEEIRAQAATLGIEIPEQTVFLDQREMQLIMAHAGISLAVEQRLPKEEQDKIAEIKAQFYELVKTDAGRVAYQLFCLEHDNSGLPYDDEFKELPKISWDDALERWKAGK